MEQLGADFNATGSLMTRQQLEEYRKKRGECVTCGRKCFKKKLFKFTPINQPGYVLNGRCLSCIPLTQKELKQINARAGIHASAAAATRTSASSNGGGAHAGSTVSVSTSIVTTSTTSTATNAPVGISTGTNGTSSHRSHSLRRSGSGTSSSSVIAASTAAAPAGNASAANLNSNPNVVVAAGTRRATQQDLERFSASQRNLSLSSSTTQRRGPTAETMSEVAMEAIRTVNLRSSSGLSSTSLQHGGLSSSVGTHSSHARTDRSFSTPNRTNNVRRTHSGSEAMPSPYSNIAAAAAAVARRGSAIQNSSAHVSISAPINGEPSEPLSTRSANSLLSVTSGAESISSSLPKSLSMSSANSQGHNHNHNRKHAHTHGHNNSNNNNNNNSSNNNNQTPASGQPNDGRLAQLHAAGSSRRNLSAAARCGHSIRPNDSNSAQSVERNASTMASASTSSVSAPIPGGMAGGNTMMNGGSNHAARRRSSGAASVTQMRKPTKEELQRAAETIMAAKQFGYDDGMYAGMMDGDDHEDDVYVPIHTVDDHEPSAGAAAAAAAAMDYDASNQANRRFSNGAHDNLRLSDSFSAAGAAVDDLEENVLQNDHHHQMHAHQQQQQQQQQQQGDSFEQIPVHGVLNRGGEFSFNIPMPSNTVAGMRHVGSSRTLSSMSSIEEEIGFGDGPPYMVGGVGGRMPSTKHISGVDAVFEGNEDGSSSLQSRTSCTSSGRFRHTTSDVDHTPDIGGSIGPNGNRVPKRSDSHSEHQYIERIRSVGPDYAEILIILREAIVSHVVVQEGLEELSSLQLTADDQDMLSEMGAAEVIVDAMQEHLSNAHVQLWGCGAVWNMSGTLRNQIAFVNAGAVDLILAAMVDFMSDIDIQEKGIAALSNMGAAVDNLAILSQKGVVEQVVAAMRKHADVARVQIKGCSVIANLASHVSPLKQKIMDSGGGDAVVISMVMHPDDVYLQEKSLRALRNLCANNDENKVDLANIGAIDAVITAMQVHRDEAGVQEEGAWTLSNLAGNDQNKADIGDCYGIDAIIRAMWVHSDNVGVEEWCCRALFTLSLDIHNGDAVLEVGGISAIVNAMQAHANSPAVQEMGCAVLGNIANTDASKMRIVDEEALDAIVMAMVLYADDGQVQERACMVLLRLAIPENFKAMQAANIGELVRTASAKFPDKCEEAASRLLYAMEN